MAGTILSSVRSALITGLDAQAGLDGVLVTYAYKQDRRQRECIWTQNARLNHVPASLRSGRNYRDEVGLFDIAVLVEGVAKTQEWTSDRACDLGLIVEEYIADRKNNELAVAGLQTLQIAGDGELQEMFNDAGHMTVLALPVRYTARLT